MFNQKYFWLVALGITFSLGLLVSVSDEFVGSTSANNVAFKENTAGQILINDLLEGDYKTRLLFSGDVFWGRRIQTWSQQSELKAAYPFSGLNTFDDIQREAWIANLECPVTSSEVSQNVQENQLKFNCKPDYLPEARKYFDVLGLANNHMDNMQEVDGIRQTRDFLEKEEFQYFGHFDNAVEDDICEIVSVDMVVGENNKATTDKLPIAICGYHSVFKLPTASEIAKISEYSKYFVTIAFPHQGKEYVTAPDQLQRSTYRSMIDSGADMVIGGHTHSIVGPEVYKDKLILYSTGNFIFDQQATELVTKGLMVLSQIELSKSEYDNYKALGLDCNKFKDDCLQKAIENNITKPEYNISYDMYATDNANKLAKRANPQDEQRILDRVGWSVMREKLNQE